MEGRESVRIVFEDVAGGFVEEEEGTERRWTERRVPSQRGRGWVVEMGI